MNVIITKEDAEKFQSKNVGIVHLDLSGRQPNFTSFGVITVVGDKYLLLQAYNGRSIKRIKLEDIYEIFIDKHHSGGEQ